MKKPKKRKMFEPNDFSDTEKRYVVFQDKLYSKGYNQACDDWEAWRLNGDEFQKVLWKFKVLERSIDFYASKENSARCTKLRKALEDYIGGEIEMFT